MNVMPTIGTGVTAMSSSNAMITTGQCQRYVPYEMRPRYTTGAKEKARASPPDGAASRPTIRRMAATVTAMPRTIGSTSTTDDANRRIPARPAQAAGEASRPRDAAR